MIAPPHTSKQTLAGGLCPVEQRWARTQYASLYTSQLWQHKDTSTWRVICTACTQLFCIYVTFLSFFLSCQCLIKKDIFKLLCVCVCLSVCSCRVRLLVCVSIVFRKLFHILWNVHFIGERLVRTLTTRDVPIDQLVNKIGRFLACSTWSWPCADQIYLHAPTRWFTSQTDYCQKL